MHPRDRGHGNPLAEPDGLWNLPAFRETPVFGFLKEAPLGFVDIGARGGAHAAVEPVASGTKVLCFEPDLEAAGEIERMAPSSPFAGLSVEPVALDRSAGTATLHLQRAETNHSLLPPNAPFTRRYDMTKFEKVGETPVQTVSLDDVLFGRRGDEPSWGEFVKLDTQGTELDILTGAERCLRERTVAILAEVEFCEIYSGQNLFSDVEIYLRGQGFSFYGFTSEFQRSRKQLDKSAEAGRERALYADAAFFKDPLPGGFLRSELSDRQIALLLLCAVLLGFYAFALELAEAVWTPPERQAARRVVKAAAAIDPAATAAIVAALHARIAEHPANANLHFGHFIDRYRPWCDYRDAPLPRDD